LCGRVNVRIFSRHLFFFVSGILSACFFLVLDIMVIPMSMPQIQGPTPPEAVAKMKAIKYCVLGIWASAVGQLVTGNVPMGELISGLNGIFLLKEDATFVACYRCLMNGIIGQCAGPDRGGLACLMPFIIISVLNCVLGVMPIYKDPRIFLLTSFACQAIGAYLAYQVYTIAQAQAGDMEGGQTAGQGQPLTQQMSSVRSFGPQPSSSDGQGGGGAGGGAGGGGAGSFTAFQGSGQRLGG